ncbi:flagellar motor switch protein FliM [Loktanella ponticola]|uniref:Flagellar motor switch protein FliM n=1 Tax=Yoonia ponticola TaxID=1524255 RepID=A0A7W9BM55_9RHOB|nr:FliM/FliN family flagellar motor switch protein [Yoonia ponticola]MBB5722866.1 flagellar motor switch protein FliM [Yoonia ponticola]
MTRQVAHDVLRRMASPPPPAPEDVPITSSRAIRLAITRAADKTHGFALSVSSLREEVLDLDALIEAFDPALMLIALMCDGRIAGLAALDLDMRAALVEVQTVGQILGDAPEDRTPTGTDARMAQPIIAAFLAHLQETAERTALDAWGAGVAVGDKIASARAAGLILDDGRYRLIRLALNLGNGDRTGEFTVALPCREEVVAKAVEPEETVDWDDQFRRVIDGSPARLNAVLHSFKLQLHQAESLAVGQVVPLPGCTVSSVKLLAGDGRKVATARLGQSGGMRAVRIEAAPHLQMSEIAYPQDSEDVDERSMKGQGFDIEGARMETGGSQNEIVSASLPTGGSHADMTLDTTKQEDERQEAPENA